GPADSARGTIARPLQLHSTAPAQTGNGPHRSELLRPCRYRELLQSPAVITLPPLPCYQRPAPPAPAGKYLPPDARVPASPLALQCRAPELVVTPGPANKPAQQSHIPVIHSDCDHSLTS